MPGRVWGFGGHRHASPSLSLLRAGAPAVRRALGSLQAWPLLHRSSQGLVSHQPLSCLQAPQCQQDQLPAGEHVSGPAEPQPALPIRQQASDHQQGALCPSAGHPDAVSMPPRVPGRAQAASNPKHVVAENIQNEGKVSPSRRSPGACSENGILIRALAWDFPGSPVVKNLRFQCRGRGFDPWSGNYHFHMLHGLPKKKQFFKKS